MKRIIITIITVLVTITANAQLKLHEDLKLHDVVVSIQDGKTQLTDSRGWIDLRFDPITDAFDRSIKIGRPVSQDPLQTLLDLYNYAVHLQPGDTVKVEDVIVPIKMSRDENGLTFKWHDNTEVAHLTSQEILYLYRELKKYMDAKRETPADLP